MTLTVHYDTTDNTYHIPFTKLLRELNLTPEQVEQAIVKVINEC